MTYLTSVSGRLAFCFGLLSLAACNEEKAVAIQTMANDLAASTTQIEIQLDVYWGNFQPATDATDKQAQIDGLASYLFNYRDEIAAFNEEDSGDESSELESETAGPQSEAEVIDLIMQTTRAMDDIGATNANNPYASGIATIGRRAEAVRDAVQYLDKGSYFASDAVLRLEPLLGSIAQDLVTLEANIRDAATAVEEVNRDEAIDFLTPSRNILAAVRDGNPTEEGLRRLISTEFERGFAAREGRLQSRDELSARILTTAKIALDMAEATRNYRKLDWASVMAMMNDLSALSSAIELPERYQVAITETRDSLEERLETIRTLAEPALD